MRTRSVAVLVALQAVFINAFELPFSLPFGLDSIFGTTCGSRELFALHKDLIDFPSVTVSEHDVGVYLADYLTARNYTVERIPVAATQENIYAYIGKGRNPRTIVTSHIDVFPPHIPYSVSGSKIFGTGSNDPKGSIATQIQAVEELRKAGKLSDGDIGLLFLNGIGMEKANDLGITLPKTIIFGGPTDLKLAVSQKGIIMFRLNFEGKPCHSGYPELGVSAIEHLIAVLSSLLNVEWPSSPIFGKTTFNIRAINGGAAANVIPATASALCSIHVAADLDETITLLKNTIGAHEGVNLNIEAAVAPIPLDTDVEGFETIAVSYFTDVTRLHGDFKRYLYGPGSIHEAYGLNEFVAKSDLLEAVEGYKKLVLHALQ